MVTEIEIKEKEGYDYRYFKDTKPLKESDYYRAVFSYIIRRERNISKCLDTK